MSIARWVYSVFGYPAWAGFNFGDERRVLTVPFTGARHEQRVRRDPRGFRTTNATVNAVSDTQRDAIDAFFRGLGFQADSFLVEDPRRNYTTAVALGTAVAAQTAFPIPASGEYGGAYPLTDALTVLRSGATAVAKTVDTDNRTLTASVAPGAGAVMTADIYFWTRVVLREPYFWTPLGEGAVWTTTMKWEEVPA